MEYSMPKTRHHFCFVICFFVVLVIDFFVAVVDFLVVDVLLDVVDFFVVLFLVAVFLLASFGGKSSAESNNQFKS